MDALTYTWFELIDVANSINISEFIFMYKYEYYISEFRNGKWTEPRIITEIK